MRLCLSLAFMMVAVISAAAQKSPLSHDAYRDQLRTKLLGQVVTLKHFYNSNHLKFDTSGKLVSDSEVGPWTIAAKIRITSVELKRDALKLKGRRIAVEFEGPDHLEYIQSDQTAELEIALGGVGSEFDDLNKALEKILVSGDQDLADYVPDYWRSAVLKVEGHPLPFEVGADLPRPSPTRSVPDFLKGSSGLLQVSSSTAPKPLYTPDPEYTDAARSAHVEGQVILWIAVGEDGAVDTVRIARPMGFGLDDEAVKAVKSWKFSPATRNGSPIRVQINVDVTFHLYH